MGERVIIPEEIKPFVNSLKMQYEQADALLEDTREYLQSVIDSDSFKGETASGMKNQLTNHLYVINEFRYFIQSGIRDCDALFNMVGYEELVEADIEESIASLTSQNEELQESIDELEDMKSTFWYVLFCGVANAQFQIAAYQRQLDNNTELIELLNKQLHKIEDIDTQARKLFDTRWTKRLEIALTELVESFQNTDFVISPLKSITVLSILRVKDSRGERIGVGKDFIQVIDEYGEIHYGGNQGWFAQQNPDMKKSGCGVIAAVNTYLYLTDQTTITKAEYMELVEEYLNSYKQVPDIQFKYGLGAFPTDMCPFIEENVKGYSGISVKTTWELGKSTEEQYDMMKEMLHQGIPVIWGLYSCKDEIMIYKYKDGMYIPREPCDGHYVTVTGIYETVDEDGNVKRMIEISSWGAVLYVDFDEYAKFREGTAVEAAVDYLGSSIMSIEIN